MAHGMEGWRSITVKETIKYRLLLDNLYKRDIIRNFPHSSEFIDESKNRLMLVTGKDEEGYRAVLTSCSIC